MQVRKVLLGIYSVGVIAIGLSSCMHKPVTAPNTVAATPQAKETKLVLDSSVAAEISKPKGKFLPETEKKWKLQHTRLALSFDWKKRYVIGEASITLIPWFYEQDSLVLDAVGFQVNSVTETIVKADTKKPKAGAATKTAKPVEQTRKFRYDNEHLVVYLSNKVKAGSEIVINVDYIAKPDSIPSGGAEAITSDKGLFFIIPDSANPDKPYQIWTQGETSSNRKWFPTLDSPNQKSTQEMYITVDTMYKTLSNGVLQYSLNNAGGTRTDVWKMDQAHAPYLFMLAVGKYAIVKDSWRGKEVSYYVEPKWERYARDIFGRTPAMMEYFSQLLGVDYPWGKYSQVVVRDYVSGAMENTTATVQREAVQKTDRELLDADEDEVISHELFHHWFGDLVTCERWGELPLNESFANYSEYLWEEKRNGRDAAESHQEDNLQQYLDEAESKDRPLIRFYESEMTNEMDMFDRHSYNKGGSTLNYLRRTIGDAAFFASLKTYLTDNAYQTSEIEKLRMAFEKTTGKDFHQFFNTYFLAKGHTTLKAANYNKDGHAELQITANHSAIADQDFSMEIDVDVFEKGKKTRHRLTLNGGENKFTFPAEASLILVDAEHSLVGTIEHIKSESELMTQLTSATLAIHREAALDSLTKGNNPTMINVGKMALKDSYFEVRRSAIKALSILDSNTKITLLPTIREMAKSDARHEVRTAALTFLGKMNDKGAKDIIEASYSAKSIKEEAAAIQAAFSLKLESAKGIKSKVEAKPEDYVLAIRILIMRQIVLNKEADKMAYFHKMKKGATDYQGFEVWQLGGSYAATQTEKVQEAYFAKTVSELPSLDFGCKIGAFVGLVELATKSKNPAQKADLEKVLADETNPQTKMYFKYFLDGSMRAGAEGQ